VEYQEETGVTLLSGAGKRVVTELPAQGSVFADFLRATYLGEKPGLTWAEIVRVNQWTMDAEEASVYQRKNR
jgi:hypothetical protein